MTATHNDLEVHRRDIRLHCYRMTGSLHDADDLAQDALVRAWQKLPSFRGESTLATWLYRIATNVCLDFLRGRKNRVLPWGPDFAQYQHGEALPPALPEAVWLEPFPTPEDQALRRENISLAFLTLLQTLTPRQRAAVILCDVLGYSAKDAAEALETTIATVNSALQRARKTLATAPRPSEIDPQGRREVVERFLKAWELGDTHGIVALMTDDTRMVMPPIPLWVQGLADIARVLDDYPLRNPRRWKLIDAAGANGESALGFYAIDGEQFKPWGIQMLSLRPSGSLPVIGEYHVFKGPHLVDRFGLPSIIDAV